MRKLHYAILIVLFTLAVSVSAFAQAAGAPKIGFINSDYFYDEQGGITKLVTATKQLDTEFAAQIKALQDGGARLQAIAKELDTMQKLPAAQFNQTAYSAKNAEGESLQRELTFKKTELETAVKKRREQLVAPISKDIGNGINEFAVKKGYGAILDTGKLADAGAVLYLADLSDATKEFIVFYNARPAPAAATAPAAKPKP
jgi:Skp family chaperone for outer membrane proteins